MMKLLQDEKVLFQVTGFWLTDRRLVQEAGSNAVSFHLEDLDSIRMTYKDYPILILLGGLVIAGSLLTWKFYDLNFALGGLVVGGLLILAYFMTRKKIIELRSHRSTILLEARIKDADELINAVEMAKKERLDQYALKVIPDLIRPSKTKRSKSEKV